jgi:hypothetical protein
LAEKFIITLEIGNRRIGRAISQGARRSPARDDAPASGVVQLGATSARFDDDQLALITVDDVVMVNDGAMSIKSIPAEMAD